MAKLLIPEPEEWKQRLTDPENQWKIGYSARALAYCWYDAQGFPPSVQQLFSTSRLLLFENLKPVCVSPEHKVALPGGKADSQNDIWVLGQCGQDFVSIAVEGKVSEPFGKENLQQWLKNASYGKRERLDYLKKVLDLPSDPSPITRYQLLHRTASAIIEATKVGAAHALMLVHSFSQNDARFDDYAFFVSLFGGVGAANSITPIGQRSGVSLYFGWVRGEQAYLKV